MKVSTKHKLQLGDYVNVEYKLDFNDKTEDFPAYVVAILEAPKTYIVDCLSCKNHLPHIKTLNQLTDTHPTVSFLYSYYNKSCLLVYEEELTLVEKGNLKFPNGLKCIECNEYNSYATINTKDCRYLCYSCKESTRWKYKKIIY